MRRGTMKMKRTMKDAGSLARIGGALGMAWRGATLQRKGARCFTYVRACALHEDTQIQILRMQD